MMIKILGPGCTNCQNLERPPERPSTELGIDATVEKVTDYAAIAGYGVMSTPGLVVDEKVLVVRTGPKARGDQAAADRRVLGMTVRLQVRS